MLNKMTLVLGAALLVSACGSESDKAEGAAVAGSGAVGVAECDAYITKYESCLSKMPAEAAEASKTGLNMMVDGWKKSLEGGVDKKSLGQGCKMADDNSKASMTAMGCDW